MCNAADWENLISKVIENEASDIHMTVGQRPHIRCQGMLRAMDVDQLTENFMSDFCAVILHERQWEQLNRDRDMDLSWTYAGRRFRVHVYYQQEHLAMALRLLPERIPTLPELGAPKAWQRMKEVDRGLILVTGRTGSGKSTTLAAFIEELNREKAYHIVTLEDPVEYVFKPDKCFISQRELGRDFYDFAAALRGALREMPDLIMVGEIRDKDTMATALMAASAGMLVLGTLHSGCAADAILRVEGMFPLEERAGVRSLLSEVLRGIFAQRLLSAAGGGRMALVEVLLANPAIRSLIRQGKYSQLESVMLSNQEQGMQTLAVAAQKLRQAGRFDQSTWEKLTGHIDEGGRS